ncbi:class I SAM-dependent methyltransferase [Nocardiopsis tropica]|nr:class I SAM-dependent methyltransferase [Nocardiopsis tropica]
MSPPSPTVEARVVDGYRHRAALARAEARPVEPTLLPEALTGVREVVEFPCGSGHFLTSYARAGVRARLIDGSSHMLAEAIRHAREAGTRELAVGHHLLHHLPALPTADLMVVPNGALNQLAALTDTTTVLSRLRTSVQTGTRMLLQAVDPTTEGTCFYTPHLTDRVWTRDHTVTTPAGYTVHRRRRQHHAPDRTQVKIEFAYTTPGPPGLAARTARVHLVLPHPDQVLGAAADAGWSTITQARHAGFIELLTEAGEVR